MIEKETSETVTPKRFYAVERYQSEIFLSSFNLMSGTSSGFSYNNILWNSGLIIPADINAHAYDVQGLRMEHVQSSDIKDNTVTTCGTGMYMQNDCSGTYTSCNSFHENYPGVFLDNITLPNQIGNCEASDNSWTGFYTNALQRIDGFGNPLTWYFSGADNSSNTTYPVPSPSFLIFPFPASCVSNHICNNGSSQLVSDDPEKKDEEINEQVDDPQMYIYYPDENEYINNEYSYHTLVENDSLINTNQREQFVSDNEQSNLGKLHDAKQLAQDGNIAAAYSKNNEVSNANLIEQNKKNINDIYFSCGAQIKDTLTSSDSLTFIQVSQQRAIDGGEAVYWTRGKLRSDAEDNNSSNLRTGGHSKPRFNSAARVRAYPNPAKEQLVLESLDQNVLLSKLVLTDSYGQEMIFAEASVISKLIDISGIQQGIYFLKVYLDNNSIKTLRITVIR